MQDAKDSILSILKIAKDDPDDDLLNALFEAFSMMNNVNQLEDFDNFIRVVLYGGKLDATAPDRTGAIIRGLQEMMSHSILSSPKTPFRALMGHLLQHFLDHYLQLLELHYAIHLKEMQLQYVRVLLQ